MQSKSEVRRGGRRLPTLIRLDRPRRDQLPCPVGLGLRQDELQLACFVAAQRQAGLVVAFDRQRWAAESGREPRHRLDGSGEVRETQAGQAGLGHASLQGSSGRPGGLPQHRAELVGRRTTRISQIDFMMMTVGDPAVGAHVVVNAGDGRALRGVGPDVKNLHRAAFAVRFQSNACGRRGLSLLEGHRTDPLDPGLGDDAWLEDHQRPAPVTALFHIEPFYALRPPQALDGHDRIVDGFLLLQRELQSEGERV